MDCGWCEKNIVTNKVPIELEHIDGNSENNSLDNLKLLCPKKDMIYYTRYFGMGTMNLIFILVIIIIHHRK